MMTDITYVRTTMRLNLRIIAELESIEKKIGGIANGRARGISLRWTRARTPYKTVSAATIFLELPRVFFVEVL